MMRKLTIAIVLVASMMTFSSCNSVENEPGTISVNFCPQKNCTTIFTEQILLANKSLYCALYDIDSKDVWQVFDKKSKEIPIRIVIDDDYKKEAQNRDFVRFDNKNGLMHNKFCIIDGKTVTGGSMNPTYNDMSKNFNNLIIISAKGIAENYQAEFEELWSGQFRAGQKNRQTLFLVNNTPIEQYFCPEDGCEKQVVQIINSANISIKFMTFSFTSIPIAVALIKAKERGVNVEGLYEKSQVNAYSVYDMLKEQSIIVNKAVSPYAGKLHHKVFIIDNQTVITGSYNPSKNGNQGNDENLIIIQNEKLATQFLNNYNEILVKLSP